MLLTVINGGKSGNYANILNNMQIQGPQRWEVNEYWLTWIVLNEESLNGLLLF